MNELGSMIGNANVAHISAHQTTGATLSFTERLYADAEAYFSTQPRRQYASPVFVMKAAVLLLMFGGAYVWFIFLVDQAPGIFIGAAVMGICHVLIPANISHDAIHKAVSSKAWINNICLYGFEITGTNSYMYAKKHLEAHWDKENGSKAKGIETQHLILQGGAGDKRVNLHPVFYLFFAQYMIFVRDFYLFVSSTHRPPVTEYVKLFVSKGLYVLFFLVIPFFLMAFPWWMILSSLLFMYLIVSVISVLILLMPTEKMEQPRYDLQSNVNDAWAVEVLRHNVDFSPDSRVLNLLAGGTNMNVVHYLFPGVCHVHYCRLAAILKNISAKGGLIYRRQSVWDVLRIHMDYITHIQKASPGDRYEKV